MGQTNGRASATPVNKKVTKKEQLKKGLGEDEKR
jgi:hypothetical protein